MEERRKKERDIAKRGSEVFLERYNSRLSAELNLKAKEDMFIEQSQAELKEKQESVERNLRLKKEA